MNEALNLLTVENAAKLTMVKLSGRVDSVLLMKGEHLTGAHGEDIRVLGKPYLCPDSPEKKILLEAMEKEPNGIHSVAINGTYTWNK